MKTEQIISVAQALGATPAELTAIKNALTKKTDEPATITDRKLLSHRHAAAVLGVSVTTLWRMVRDGKLKTVEIRNGRKRILSQSITDFVGVAQ